MMSKLLTVLLGSCVFVNLTFAVEPDKIVKIGKEVQLSATATDKDCHFKTGECPHLDTDTAITITWSAVWKNTTIPAGTFKNGINTGTSVTWIAPCTAGDVTITATADNSQSTKAIDGDASDNIWVQVNSFNITAIEISDGSGPQPWSIPLRDTDDIIVDISVDTPINNLDCFPDTFTISTSKRASINWPINETNSDIVNNGQTVRVTIPNAEARIYQLIMDPLYTYDYFSFESGGSVNFNDSDRYDFHYYPTCVIARAPGNWTDEPVQIGAGTLPPWTADAEQEFLILGGAIYLNCSIAGKTDKGMIQHQADEIYLSGHGSHATGQFHNTDPEDLEWSNKEVVIIAGCSVLDIDDLNDNYDDDEHPTTPGRRWASLSVKYLLGYNWYAPSDEHPVGVPPSPDPYFTANIVTSFVTRRAGGYPVTVAWGEANEVHAGGPRDSPWNACAIDTSNQLYWYWDRVGLFHVWTSYVY